MFEVKNKGMNVVLTIDGVNHSLSVTEATAMRYRLYDAIGSIRAITSRGKCRVFEKESPLGITKG